MIPLELQPFQVALINQALQYYKSKVNDIIEAAQDQPNFNTANFLERLYWLKTETAATQVLVTKNMQPAELELSCYHQKRK